jgi:DNA-binding NarL/FixJ family response regulator
MKIRVLIADDHPIVLDALESLFAQEDDIEVVARCISGDEVLEAVQKKRPDVAILDISMPRKGGLETLRELKTVAPEVRVVFLAASIPDEEMVEAIGLGISGVVLKEMAPDMVVKCVRKVHAGEQWLEKRSIARALEKMMLREATGRSLAGLLTTREMDILRLVASGLRNKEVATRLFISEGTVKIHLHNIYDKLGVNSRTGLAAYARARGLT